KQALVKKLGPQLLEFIGVANIRRIQQAHAEMHPGSELLDPVALFERYTGEAFARLEGVLNKQIPPEWTAEIVHSLKEDAREVICGPRRDVPPGDETGVERLYEKIASRGFEEVVERAVGETFVKIREVFSDKVDDFFAMATRFLPSSALTALTAQGIVPNIETPFWIDFVKEANGNYTVRFFANALGAEAFDEVTIDQKTGLRVPLIFENVPAEKLTKDFFRLLVDYEYRPKYKEEVHSYTPEHVVHGLKGILGEPSAAQSIQDLLPHVVVEERGALSLAQIYLFSNQDRDICVFYSEQSFDVLLNTFLDFWQEHGTVEELRKDRKLRLQMRNAINRIADEAILLHSDEVISTERLRSIYATIWEIEKVMHLAEKRRVQDEFRGGTVVPPGIQSHIKGLLLESGADPTYLEVVKETFLAAAGDDCEEIFDAALEELLPEIVSSKSITEAEVLDWKDIFKIETVKSKIAYLRMNRLSLLQLVKFYAKILVMLCMIYRVTLSAKTIQKTIEKYYPGIKKHLPFSTFHVGMMLTLFGPHFFAKTLPKDVYETLAAIYNLANDVSWYVFNRVLTNGFKQILKQVIPTEEKERVRNLAKTVQQEVLRKGELDYQVARSEGNADAVTLERHPMPLPAAFAAHVVTPLFQDDTPKPTATVLTAENYQDTIAGWIADAETLRARFGDEQNYHLIYLNEQIRNLKVPFGDTEDVWDEIMGCADELYAQAEAAESSADELRLTQQADQMRQRTINEALESVHTLLVALYAASENGQQIPQHRTETVISFYTLYAVIDALAKGSDNSGLTHFSHSANAADLCRYIQKAGVKVAHSKSLQQLRDLSHYYEFDLGERLTEEEIQKKFAFCHFNFDGSGTWLFGKAFSGEEETRRVSVTPWQTFRSVEHNYFSDLMKRPDVAQRLAAHGVTRETPLSEKLMILFRDPPRSEARVDRRGAIDATCSPGDPRKGILPREYYLLRLAHLMSSSRALFGEQLEETFLNAPMDQGLVISRVMVPDAAPTNIFATAKQWLYRARDVVTRGAFQAQAMRGNLAVLSQEARRVQAAKDRTIGRTLTGTGSEYTIGASQREQERYQKEEAFIGKRVSQSAVMAAMRQADSKSLLTVEEKRILEMVQSYDKDRLIRAIGLFSYRKERLRHPEFRLLFDLLCQNLIALEAQAQERVEVGRNIGKFFGETIDHFKNIGDLETALYMVRMGVELEGFFCSHDPALRAAFPDFAYEIREHIIPAYQERPEKKRKVCFGEAAQIDGIYLAVTTLANVYMNQDVESLGDVNKTIALMDIARFAFYQGRQHEEFLDQPLYREAKRVVYRNAAALKQLMMDQPGVRALVLDRVFADAGLNLPEGAWTGDFPTYTKQPDGPTIDLSERTIDGHESVYLREKGEEELRRIFRKEDLGPYDYIGLNTYYYPELGITIEWDDVTRRFEIQKEIDGEAALYYRQDEVTINWEFSPFTFEERDIIFISDSKIHVYRDGEEIVRFTTEADGAGLKVVKREHRINGGWHQAVDLRNQKHQLTLLNWFVDLEDIEAFSQPAQGEEGKERLTYFRLKKVGMEFKVEENGDGKFQAVSITEGTKGYVLCARQDDDRLYRYPHAILLRNETGAEKVILKSLPFATIFMKFVVNNVAG
ncbi:MAG: hypothetical protein KDK64_08275, partial [Chlamydiia bacterium]|nr:hypothetical protein [Chlamydiia bacterium]